MDMSGPNVYRPAWVEEVNLWAGLGISKNPTQPVPLSSLTLSPPLYKSCEKSPKGKPNSEPNFHQSFTSTSKFSKEVKRACFANTR